MTTRMTGESGERREQKPERRNAAGTVIHIRSLTDLVKASRESTERVRELGRPAGPLGKSFGVTTAAS